jgi:hypothetical protein
MLFWQHKFSGQIDIVIIYFNKMGPLLFQSVLLGVGRSVGVGPPPAGAPPGHTPTFEETHGSLLAVCLPLPVG